jgi:polar amino acid transport system permease protein
MMRPFSLGDLVFMLLAVRWTVLLASVSIVGGAVLGLIVALLRSSENPVLKAISIVYIRINQGTPLLLQLFVAYFGADIIGLPSDAFTAAVLALSVNASAFLGDIWRGAIQSVPRGQTEAARALGLSYRFRMQDIVLPQAVRIATPPTVGFLVHHIKSTSLASLIGYVELTRAGHLVNATAFQPFLIFGTIGAVYFALCWPLSLASQRLELRLAQPHQR